MSTFVRVRLTRRWFWTAAALVAVVCLGGPFSTFAEPAKATRANAYSKELQPFFKEFCYECHNDRMHKGGLSLARLAEEKSLTSEREVWVELLRKLRAGEMPPEGKRQPDEQKRAQMAAWIENELFPVDCANPDPGRVTIRRLNRVEYGNTIRDLVGVQFKATEDFPADDSGYGFDNIGDALSVSPLLLERYLAAAETIVRAAIVDPAAVKVPKRTFSGAKLMGSTGGGPGGQGVYAFSSNGSGFVGVEVATNGEYRILVRAYAQQAGPELARMGLLLDKKQVQVWDVKGQEASGEYQYEVPLDSGHHRIEVAFLNDYYQPSDPDPKNRDRNLFVEEVQLVGPLNPVLPPVPETHRRIFFVAPRPGHTNETARLILGRFATRAFRRPVAGDELDRLTALCESAWRAGGSFEGGVGVALQAVLVSPHFLFRGELQTEPDNSRVKAQIDEFALASRLSYFLWSTMPDEELCGLAARGRLRKNLEAQVQRMLADAKAQALVENFGGQWLQTRNLELAAPDPTVYPTFDDELRKAMRQETEMFLASILREDRSVFDLINGEYTFVNERLARLYALPGVQGAEFRRVSLKGTGRAGVLTQGSVLTVTSNPTRTSPVKRGKWVLENLLAQAPPPPPPNVPPLNDTKEAATESSLRQRMEVHRANPLCASCHSQMDPIGFSLEHFDGIGARREKDGPFAVDASGRLPGGETFDGAMELERLIANSRREQFLKCLSEKMLTYALGRGLEPFDRCAVEKITQRVARNGNRFSALILGIVESVPFQMRRGESSH